MNLPENTTTQKFFIEQWVKPKGYSKNARRGIIKNIIPPFGTAGEWSYEIDWKIAGTGCGWRDCDLLPA